jgi:hypothetical protein
MSAKHLRPFIGHLSLRAAIPLRSFGERILLPRVALLPKSVRLKARLGEPMCLPSPGRHSSRWDER